jgi:class 3 adenylate cyclase
MSTYSVMFVDIVDSTKLKHLHDPRDAFDMTRWLFRSIQRKAPNGAKFTGDGGMVVYPEWEGGSQRAVLEAQSIIQEVDGLNLAFKRIIELDPASRRDPTTSDPRTGSDIRLKVRIGIATGTPSQINENPLDVVGTEADLAARLSSEADPDGILVDQLTRDTAIQKEELRNRFQECPRRLQLKGIPKNVDGFYHFIPERLIGQPANGPFVGGVLALFTHRDSLNVSFPPGRILELAAKDSELLVAGRTLKFWSHMVLSEDKYLRLAQEKRLKLHFLMSSQASCEFLDPVQVKIIKKDRPEAIEIFNRIESRSDGFEFRLKETKHLFLDGLVYAEIELPGRPVVLEKTRIALQDINATEMEEARDDPKATLLLACICHQDNQRRKYCKACGLYDRTVKIYKHHAKRLS